MIAIYVGTTGDLARPAAGQRRDAGPGPGRRAAAPRLRDRATDPPAIEWRDQFSSAVAVSTALQTRTPRSGRRTLGREVGSAATALLSHHGRWAQGARGSASRVEIILRGA